MRLERKMAEVCMDLTKQIKLVESFLEEHAPIFNKLKPLV